MTPEEFDAADDFAENYGYELIHGVLIVSPPPLNRNAVPMTSWAGLSSTTRRVSLRVELLTGLFPSKPYAPARAAAGRIGSSGLALVVFPTSRTMSRPSPSIRLRAA